MSYKNSVESQFFSHKQECPRFVPKTSTINTLLYKSVWQSKDCSSNSSFSVLSTDGKMNSFWCLIFLNSKLAFIIRHLFNKYDIKKLIFSDLNLVFKTFVEGEQFVSNVFLFIILK